MWANLIFHKLAPLPTFHCFFADSLLLVVV